MTPRVAEESFGNMEERFAVFAAAMAPGNPPLLRALEEKARADGVPVIRQGTQSLIRFLLELKRPQRILEVGTGVGFSALLMRDALDGACETDDALSGACENNDTLRDACENDDMLREACEIVTIEKDPARAAEAERNFAQAGCGQIKLLTGEAEEILRQLVETEPGSFDFVFMDAAKGQYIHFLPMIGELTRAGGILLSDNILKEGEILESRYAVTRRDRTIHARMREYLLALCRSDDWRTVLLEEGDGTALSVRRGKELSVRRRLAAPTQDRIHTHRAEADNCI